MRLRSLILFQICKLQCEVDTRSSFDAGDLGSDPIIMWIGIENPHYHGYSLTRNKDDAYVEDKVTVGLLLLVGSHKVCPGKAIQVMLLLSVINICRTRIVLVADSAKIIFAVLRLSW